uniref:Uncharacterized protein n=1 Tax=Anguilla anguilla TaxID=7936 RepID=A0A0E9XVQ9_ANGAN
MYLKELLRLLIVLLFLQFLYYFTVVPFMLS